MNGIAVDVTGVGRQGGHLTTRRWYYLIPAQGEPRGVVHAIERHPRAAWRARVAQGGERIQVRWTPVEMHRHNRANDSAGRIGDQEYSELVDEAKEFLAGYWIVEVDRTERAYEIAARASAR